ncbi:ribosome recycling factor [bacterium]|nr:ribosome recycling factor [bacterium]
MLEEVFQSFTDDANKAIESLKHALGKLRTGRANSSILDDVRVDYYGTPTPIVQMAAINIPEPRVITIKPWEKNMLAKIEKAILASDLGLNPNNNGDFIILTLPQLTEERRRDLVKSAKKIGEDIKVSLRGHRHSALDMLKDLEKEKDISEDDHKKGRDRIQDLINDYSKNVDDIIKIKEEEILKV